MELNQTYKVGQTYFSKQPLTKAKPNQQVNQEKAVNFNSILNDKLQQGQEVIFSMHAKQRLDSRGIQLDAQAISQLNTAVQKASQKGSKDSLILMKNLAFVVNVPNRVVVTAVDEASMKEHVFTNIDSAIII